MAGLCGMASTTQPLHPKLSAAKLISRRDCKSLPCRDAGHPELARLQIRAITKAVSTIVMLIGRVARAQGYFSASYWHGCLPRGEA